MEEMIAFNKESNPAKAVQSSEQPLDVTELSDEEKKKQQEAESRREKEAERKWEEADITNDFIFYTMNTQS